MAPKKELIWFEESAHFPNFEEYEKFNELVIRIKDNIESEVNHGKFKHK
ncbi:hypothetical protein [Tissierella praeacuta]